MRTRDFFLTMLSNKRRLWRTASKKWASKSDDFCDTFPKIGEFCLNLSIWSLSKANNGFGLSIRAKCSSVSTVKWLWCSAMLSIRPEKAAVKTSIAPNHNTIMSRVRVFIRCSQSEKPWKIYQLLRYGLILHETNVNLPSAGWLHATEAKFHVKSHVLHFTRRESPNESLKLITNGRMIRLAKHAAQILKEGWQWKDHGLSFTINGSIYLPIKCFAKLLSQWKYGGARWRVNWSQQGDLRPDIYHAKWLSTEHLVPCQIGELHEDINFLNMWASACEVSS